MGRDKKEVDEETLFDAIMSGVPKKELATIFGISGPTLSARIADLQQKQGALLQYRAIQALQLTEIQARILEAITPEKIEQAELKDLVMCYKVLKDKELVTEGKPSEIKGLVSYLVHLEKEQMACSTPVTIEAEFNDTDVDFPEEKLPEL